MVIRALTNPLTIGRSPHPREQFTMGSYDEQRVKGGPIFLFGHHIRVEYDIDLTARVQGYAVEVGQVVKEDQRKLTPVLYVGDE